MTFKLYNSLLQMSILLFTSALVYFAFVYYPKAINTYKGFGPSQKPLVAPVGAENKRFPIETANYRVVYEASSETYYVFVEGATLNEYLTNKNGADLAMKNALSENSLCGLNIIYSSNQRLPIPERYKTAADC